MQVIIDTHILIWYFTGSNLLSLNAKNILENKANKIYLSIVSVWEIIIKKNIGKLDFNLTIKELYNELQKMDVIILGITKNDLLVLENLILHHKDPFDRIIVSQAISNNIFLLSVDKIFDNYDIERIY